MKTSRYLQITLFIFIVGVTLTLFISAKNYEETNKNKPKINPEETVDLKVIEDFSVIVVRENAKVTIVKDLITSIHIYDKNYGVIKDHYNFKDIKLKNDTLFVDSIDSKYVVNIHANSLQEIIGLQNSEIRLNTFYNDTLNIDLTKSKLRGSLRNNLINSLKIKAKEQSKVNLYRKSIFIFDSITKKRKLLRKNFKLQNVAVQLKGNSKLTIPKPLKLVIDTDSLSTYNFHL